MLHYPKIDPIIFQVGPLAPRWYGLMYLIGFIFTYKRLQKNWKWLGLKSEEQVDSVLGTLVICMLIVSRIVYVVFYNWDETMAGPWYEFIAVWHGGLAFHGGQLGSALGVILVARRYKLQWLRLADLICTVAPIGLGLGRIGNFINGELFGRVTDVPWAMVFPNGGPYPRHPSQIYQAFCEGLLLYIIVNAVWRRRPNLGITSAVYLMTYAVFRSLVELVREPDAQVGYLFDFFTMGQLLSFFMFFCGVFVWWYARKRKLSF